MASVTLQKLGRIHTLARNMQESKVKPIVSSNAAILGGSVALSQPNS